MNEIEDEIAELRQAYSSGLPAKARAIADAIAARDHSTAIALAHRLRGTAGAYGFGNISTAAGVLEDELTRGEDWAALDVATAALMVEAAR